jgi:hypothetical protein
VEGGLEELLEFWLSRASSSATRAVSASTSAISLAMNLIARGYLRFQLRDARVSGIHLHHVLATPRQTSSCPSPLVQHHVSGHAVPGSPSTKPMR